MTITFRLEQGYALSYAQVDENFRSVQELTGLAQQFAIDAQEASDIAAQARDDAIDAKDEAALIVANAATHLGNIASVDPAPSKVPLAGAEGTIKQAWVDSLEFELDALRVAKNKALYGDGPYPVLDLQFQGAKILDPRITFTRATPDWDWEGKRYEVNEPVLTDNGLWMWENRTNLYRNSLTDQAITVTARQYTISFYGEGSIELSGAHAHTVVSTGERTTYTFTPASEQLNISPSGVEKVQLEIGAVATPYIPTNGSQVTVARAFFEVKGSGFSEVFNPAAGTLHASIGENNLRSASSSTPYANIGLLSNEFFIISGGLAWLGPEVQARDVLGENRKSIVDLGGLTQEQMRVAISYTSNGIFASLNGNDTKGAVLADTEYFTNITRLWVDGLVNGYLKQLSYYNTSFSDEQLQELTS